jgi:predicted flap endonuclease-1-like 5' DNA nuclease
VQGHTVQTGLPANEPEGENPASLGVSQVEQTGDEAPSGQALDAKNEDAVPFSVKEAAISSALSAGVTTGELEAPQDLLRLPGIGPRYQSMLYAAGIGTFWEFASCSDKVILAALELDDTDRMRAKASEARSEARKLASETGTVGMLWSRA